MYKHEHRGFFRKTWHLTSTEPLTPSDFDALAKQLSLTPLLAQKIGFVATRQAETVEKVDTHYEGHETTNTANIGDWIVTNMTPGGKALRDSSGRLNTYVIAADTFGRLYEATGRQSEFGPLYSARGTVSVLKLPGSFDIVAPWKEHQKGKAGYLIRNGDEIYGIEKSVFHRTYDIRGPGALKLLRPGRKRLLCLDGGGVRGMLTIAFLERLEDELRKQHGNPKLVLSDYFDMIGGTSVGAILATQLALGETVENVKKLFSDWCPRSSGPQPSGASPKGSSHTSANFWCHASTRATWKKGSGKSSATCDLALRSSRPGCASSPSGWIRAVLGCSPTIRVRNSGSETMSGWSPTRNTAWRTSCAPAQPRPTTSSRTRSRSTLDEKTKPGLFVDGAVSPYNNPALQMLMLAGIGGYGLDWPLGEDNLFIVSVGTGSYRLRSDGRGISAEQAVTALSGVIGDGEALTLTLLQWLSASSNPWKINSEIGDLSEDYLGQRQGLAKPLLRFRRYDAPLEADWLKDQLNRDFSKVELDSLRDFTNPRNVNKLYEIGSEAAKKQIQAEHLPHDFTVEMRAV